MSNSMVSLFTGVVLEVDEYDDCFVRWGHDGDRSAVIDVLAVAAARLVRWIILVAVLDPAIERARRAAKIPAVMVQMLLVGG